MPIFCSWSAKIVKRPILVQFLFISHNYTYFLANKSTTLDNFGISRLLQTNAFSMAQDLGLSIVGAGVSVRHDNISFLLYRSMC